MGWDITSISLHWHPAKPAGKRGVTDVIQVTKFYRFIASERPDNGHGNRLPPLTLSSSRFFSAKHACSKQSDQTDNDQIDGYDVI
jgi:hypothetical protein